MANASTKDAPLQSTRQLLSELDALMERMLALPIEDQPDDGQGPGLEVAAPVAGAEEAADSAAPAAPSIAATLTVIESAEQDEAAAIEAADSAPATFPDRSIDAPPPPEAHAAPAEADVSQVHYITAELDPPLPALTHVAAPPKEKLLPLPPRIWARPSLGLQFLLWVNRGYDRSSLWLGRPGRWLRGRFMRMILGCVGLGLLAAALAWLARDWQLWLQ